MGRERLWYKALMPEGGASDVGEAIAHYARANKVQQLRGWEMLMWHPKQCLVDGLGISKQALQSLLCFHKEIMFLRMHWVMWMQLMFLCHS